MGNYISKEANNNDYNYGSSSVTKRKRDLSLEEHNDELSVSSISKRRRLTKSTSQYIYDTLFLNGEDSDVTIEALGKKWMLHKIYLKRASYFQSMFSGSWKESDDRNIKIEIIDENITVDAFNTALASLYTDDIEISPSDVISTVAVATMLQIENLIERCVDIMISNMSDKNELVFREAAAIYGLSEVSKRCMEWLELRLLTIKRYDLKLLQSIDVDWIEKIVSSPTFLASQVEMDIYAMLKRWMFLKLHPNWYKGCEHKSAQQAFEQIKNDMDAYFSDRTDKAAFLETDEGQPFIPAFRQVKFKHVLNDADLAHQIHNENIVPLDWLLPVYRQEWLNMLAVEHGYDSGPAFASEEEFYRNCIRLGRMIKTDSDYRWRWTGFRFGLDVVMNYCQKPPRRLTLKRNVSDHNTLSSISFDNVRLVLAKFTIISYDEDCQIENYHSTDILNFSLHPDEEVVIMHIKQNIKYPLYLGVQLLVTSPKKSPLSTKSV